MRKKSKKRTREEAAGTVYKRINPRYSSLLSEQKPRRKTAKEIADYNKQNISFLQSAVAAEGFYWVDE